MGKRGWLNLALLLAVAVLAAVVYWQPGKQSEPASPLTPLDPTAVQRMTIERPAAETIVLQRQDKQWRMIEPLAVAANSFQVRRVLEPLTQQSLQRYPAAGLELTKYGLRPPRAKLTADGVELSFGKVNPLNSRLYVRVDDVMHMVAQNDISFLTAPWLEFVSTAPLPDAPLAGLTLPGLGTITKDQAGWRYEGPSAPQSADQLQALVDNWRHLRALRVRPLQAADISQQVEVRLASGATLQFALQSDADALVLQRRDLGLEYVFDGDQSQRLLAWPPLHGADGSLPANEGD
ncbi:hypothetical protein Tel_00390 [Candidatus Tenderia electrophaga]|jgi:hypothetical protein|uniref:DUF4340 domain-containing protein n=1 Tax=Candidatus Tenderia electrophaga TaxID=1748243 RepID=A0A0S2T9A8_9GAMM|nr:hypothetical protein Tel_00390 [Candidatus Tenderia electrophaga]